MKNRFRIITILLLCAVLMMNAALPSGAMLAPAWIGDVDQDFQITILDATKIQRFLAGLEEPDELETALSDADGDGDMTVLDATAIQRELADLPGSFAHGELYDCYIGDSSFHSSAEIMTAGGYLPSDEVCYVGVPVTFTAQVKWGAQPRRFTLSIDGEIVGQADASGYDAHAFTYTFEKEGIYEVCTAVECRYGRQADHTRTVRVVPLPEDGRPVIMGATFYDASRMDSGDSVLTVTAVGGTAPYEYCYTVYYADPRVVYDIPEGVMQVIPPVPENAYSTDYIKEDHIKLTDIPVEPDELPPEWGFGTLYARITARDADGKESEPVAAGYIGYAVEA